MKETRTCCFSNNENFSDNVSVRALAPEEWHLIRETYETEFENRMPENPAQSIFYGIFLDDKLIGFTHVEAVFHLNAVYLKPDARKAEYARAAFDEINKGIPRTFPLIILPDKPLRRLIESYGFRNLGEIQIFRKDY